MPEEPLEDRTKRALDAALRQLLEEKPLDQIRVRELTALCGIRRQSFYYHFPDVYALFAWSLARETEGLLARQAQCLTWQQALRTLLVRLAQNRPYYRALLEHRGRAGLREVLALGGLLEPETVKVVLYIVVLLSGLAIILRELRPQKSGGGSFPGTPPLLARGFATALLCALSGAGGPVLVMPLLVAMGVPAKTAVGVALLDSVFIALPAIAVYGSRCGALAALLPVLLAAALGHAAGVSVGSVTAAHVPQSLLKRGVAVFSICFSLLMLLK